MRGKWIVCMMGLISCYSLSGWANHEIMWKGELFGITPINKKTTLDYCKSHALDTYQASADKISKEFIADNGVKAKSISQVVTEQGSVYFRKGVTVFSGISSGKPWQEKAHYFGQGLTPVGGMEQGVWYTEKCKGFYKVGPA